MRAERRRVTIAVSAVPRHDSARYSPTYTRPAEHLYQGRRGRLRILWCDQAFPFHPSATVSSESGRCRRPTAVQPAGPGHETLVRLTSLPAGTVRSDQRAPSQRSASGPDTPPPTARQPAPDQHDTADNWVPVADVEIEVRRARCVEIMLQLATFPEAPLRSRTVGFPESGSGLGSARHFSGLAFPRARNCDAGAPFAPTRWSLHRPFATTQARQNPALCLVAYPTVVATECPEPLARSGRYPRRGGLRAAWRGVTPSSSLVRAHPPDHPPPAPRLAPLRAGSLQVVASPCCEMALPDVISAILA